MSANILDFLPNIQEYSETLDDLTLLINKRWVSIDSNLNGNTVYIFRANNDLTISINRKVEKVKWNYHGNQSILISIGDYNYLLNLVFYNQNILLLKTDSSKKYAVYVNENKYDEQLNSVQKVKELLELKYLRHKRDYLYQKLIRERREKSFEDRKKGTIKLEEEKALYYSRIWTELHLLCFVLILLTFFVYIILPVFI